MAAEFYIKFRNVKWFQQNKQKLEETLKGLPTFVKHQNGEFWFRGIESEKAPASWDFDVRIFINRTDDAFLEIGAHPQSIERDLQRLFSSLRNETDFDVVDEDGEPTNWWIEPRVLLRTP